MPPRDVSSIIRASSRGTAMPRTLAPTIAGCAAVAALVLAAPNPPTATAGSTAAHRVERDAGMVQPAIGGGSIHMATATATAMAIPLMAIIGPTATTVLTPITADLMATTV